MESVTAIGECTFFSVYRDSSHTNSRRAIIDDDDSTHSALNSGSNVNGGWSLDDLTPSGKLARSILVNSTSA